jgi:hypothetical protein
MNITSSIYDCDSNYTIANTNANSLIIPDGTSAQVEFTTNAVKHVMENMFGSNSISKDNNFSVVISKIDKDKITIGVYKCVPFAISDTPWFQELEFIKIDSLFVLDLSKLNSVIIDLLINSNIIERKNNVGSLTASLLCKLI